MSDRQSLLGSHQQSWWFNEINYLLSVRIYEKQIIENIDHLQIIHLLKLL